MIRRAAAVVLVLGAAMMGGAGTALAADPPPGVRTHCTVDDPRLAELSGLVVDGTPDKPTVWAMSDGGNRVAAYSIDPQTCAVTGSRTATTNPFDAEDLARGPDGALWVADIGDNRSARNTVAVVTLPASGASKLYRFTYPDGPHDAEALLVGSDGVPVIVTKDPVTAAGIYRPQAAPTGVGPTPLTKVGQVSLPSSDTQGGPLGGSGRGWSQALPPAPTARPSRCAATPMPGSTRSRLPATPPRSSPRWGPPRCASRCPTNRRARPSRSTPRARSGRRGDPGRYARCAALGRRRGRDAGGRRHLAGAPAHGGRHRRAGGPHLVAGDARRRRHRGGARAGRDPDGAAVVQPVAPGAAAARGRGRRRADAHRGGCRGPGSARGVRRRRDVTRRDGRRRGAARSAGSGRSGYRQRSRRSGTFRRLGSTRPAAVGSGPNRSGSARSGSARSGATWSGASGSGPTRSGPARSGPARRGPARWPGSA
ncbi:hypothetical protein ACFQV8_25980 [Pseudonocardia benzenivorans]